MEPPANPKRHGLHPQAAKTGLLQTSAQEEPGGGP